MCIRDSRTGAPPTIVFLGTEDKLIPVTTAKRYQSLMDGVDADCEHHFYDGQPHGFFNYAKKENFLDTVHKMDQFLQKLGWIQGPAQVNYEAVKP